jgi:hypothetical protein
MVLKGKSTTTGKGARAFEWNTATFQIECPSWPGGLLVEWQVGTMKRTDHRYFRRLAAPAASAALR